MSSHGDHYHRREEQEGHYGYQHQHNRLGEHQDHYYNQFDPQAPRAPPPVYPPQHFDPFAPSPHFAAAPPFLSPHLYPPSAYPPPPYPPPESHNGYQHSVYPPPPPPPPHLSSAPYPPLPSQGHVYPPVSQYYQSTHITHEFHEFTYPPPAPHQHDPVPAYPQTQHHSPPSVEEDSSNQKIREDSDHHTPDVELPKGQLVRVFCKSAHNFNLAARNGKAVMAHADPQEESQQWIRDDKYGISIRDSYGHPAFMLINRSCKKVLKHTGEQPNQVVLVDYMPGMEDDDLFWTESQDFGEGFKTVRMISNTLLNLTVLHGDTKAGGVRDGSSIVLDTWHKKDHQLWKVFPL